MDGARRWWLVAGALGALVVVAAAAALMRSNDDETIEASAPDGAANTTTSQSTDEVSEDETTSSVTSTSTTAASTTSSMEPTATSTTAAPDEQPFAPLVIRVTTDARRYTDGEIVRITIESCNESDQTYTQQKSGPIANTTVRDKDDAVVADYQPSGGAPAVVEPFSWAPRECKRGGYEWRQNAGPLTYDGTDEREPGPRVEPGTYHVAVEWLGWEEDDGPQRPAPVFESEPFDLA